MTSRDPKADARAETASAVLRAEPGGRSVLLAFCDDNTSMFELPESGDVIIGRVPECQLQIDHPSVSRQHATVHAGHPLTIEDLGSRNGTRVRGVLIAQRHRAPLHAGDVVECGDALLIVRQVPLDAKGPATEAIATANHSVRGLVVGADARWFQPLGGAQVNLGRRGPLRRVLLELAQQRVASPGVGVPLDRVIAAGWPAEKMLHEAAVARVYTTIQRLRALGLANVLLTRDDGYHFDPAIDVRLDER